MTLAMFPVLVFMYVHLARTEERQALAEFGADYERYMRDDVRGFVPRLGDLTGNPRHGGAGLQYDMSGFPVVDRGKLVWIVTEGDFLRRTETGTERHRTRWIEFLTGPGQLAEEYAHAHGRTVDEVMTREVVTVAEDTSLEEEDTSLEEAVRLMERHHIKRLPVVKGDTIVGILTRANLLHAFIVSSPKTTAAPVTDAAIREKLAGKLEKQPWAPRGSFNAVIENGGVDLQGIILDERQRAALRIAAKKYPWGQTRSATISSNSIGARSSDEPRRSFLASPTSRPATSQLALGDTPAMLIPPAFLQLPERPSP